LLPKLSQPIKERSINVILLAQAELGQKIPRYAIGPVMPRLDKNGLMAGSAERCENRSAGAGELLPGKRCVCESGSKPLLKSWVQMGPTGEQKPGRVWLSRLEEQPRERGNDNEKCEEWGRSKRVGGWLITLVQRVDVDAPIEVTSIHVWD
jgi:hypothetical protein